MTRGLHFPSWFAITLLDLAHRPHSRRNVVGAGRFQLGRLDVGDLRVFDDQPADGTKRLLQAGDERLAVHSVRRVLFQAPAVILL